MKEQIIAANLWKDDKGKFKPKELAHFLHDNVTEQVSNVLYAIHSIAKDDFLDDIDEKLDALKMPNNLFEDIYSKAANLALKSIDICNRIISKRFISERHSYTHFKPTIKRELKALTKAQIDELKGILKAFFKNTNKGDYADIFDHTLDDYAFYCISHGSVKMRENSVEEELTVHTFRPELVDIVRLNLKNGEISVFTQKTTSKGLKKYYVDKFKEYVAPKADYIVNKKYLPNAIKEKSALQLGAFVGKITAVNLVQFIAEFKGSQISCTKDVSAIFRDLQNTTADFTSVTLEFQFATTKEKTFNVRITDKGISEIPNGCDEVLVEQFLTQNGFIRKETNANEFTLEQTRASTAA